MKETFDLNEYIMHHMKDSHEWHLPFLPTIHLPEFLSLHGLMVILSALFLILLFGVFTRKNQRVPRGLTNLLEVIVIFIRDQIVVAHIGEKDGRRMTPLFCTFFFFILTLNLMGLIPFFVTATANINVTAALALITLCFMIFGAVYKNGLRGFFKALTPSGVPVPLLILLVPLEFIGLFVKAFSLTIRLFANMFAGHIVIFSLLGLVILLGFVALPSVLLALFIYILEVLVAFLQAYIFTFLSAMFIGHIYHAEH
ncbi:MAG TPA: ATP synthase F0 subunit A [Candidatus Omnitrophica bacterium]|nr:MAG: ATP synthase F0 subunit A [Omnitrophica WOR_2 bacterium GWA2_45_18]OGX19025.1 MAG: ATP synthase F0 subunit A [Omnitrophica WOR_2 bacterium GWC2_45_7]HBR15772.1 ATP synthase F0 subunit A [Candidatus Omnitrophota bacterium]